METPALGEKDRDAAYQGRLQEVDITSRVKSDDG